jgi:membrane protease YdiL (CAAX protease family)
MPKTTISLAEAAIVSTICFGFMTVLSIHAMLNGFPERPFTDSNTLYMIFLELVFGGTALVYLRARNFDILSLIPHPRFLGAAAGVGLYLAIWILGAIVTLPFAGAQGVQPIQRMVLESALSLPIIVAYALVNGVFEEVFLLGVLVRGLRTLGLSLAIGLPLLVRVAYHLYQGPIGALWILVFGVVLTLFYVRYVSLWSPVFAHVLGDIVPFAMGA